METRMASDQPRHSWRTDETDDLLEAILSLQTADEAAAFFRDLCTLSELEAMAHRWQVARLVDAGLPYQAVASRTGGSTTTVTVVARGRRQGEGGYRVGREGTPPHSVQTA